MEKNFKINTERKRMPQSFNKDEISIIKAGKEINVYNLIQENKEDTEIYPTLERYGCIDRMMLNTQETYDDLRNIKDLRGTMEQIEKANQMWKNLPLETRKEFNHSRKEFLEKGEKWLQSKIESEKPKEQPIETPTENKVEANNG